MNNKNISIVGAGASGLISSIIIASAGFKVTVFEKNQKIGRKILATGNGRCNISNKNISLLNFNSNSSDFIKYALEQFDYKKFKSFFENLGLELEIKDNGRIYPKTQQASSVVDLLVYEAKRVGVKFILNTKIENIKFQNNKFILEYKTNTDTIKEAFFDKTIISTGSLSYPKLGSCDSGYKFAKNFGHNIIHPLPSLVQLQSDNKSIKNLSGVKISAKVDLEINKKYITSFIDDVLFTDYGVSGSAILDISKEASYALYINNEVSIKIDMFPDISKDMLIAKLTKRLKNSKEKDKYFALIGLINKKLIPYIIDSCGIKKEKQLASELTKKDIISLAYFMKNIKIGINDTKGFQTAEVSIGGVDLSQVESKTMESKLKNNLYFTGEVLDVDGQCGGYNLHWAWASGWIAGHSIINTI